MASDGSGCVLRAAEKQKETSWGRLVYKQAIPTGFQDLDTRSSSIGFASRGSGLLDVSAKDAGNDKCPLPLWIEAILRDRQLQSHPAIKAPNEGLEVKTIRPTITGRPDLC